VKIKDQRKNKVKAQEKSKANLFDVLCAKEILLCALQKKT
jgi:hypothetical protein